MAQNRGASTLSSSISLIKTIIGAGLLSMPFAYSTDGSIFGTIVILCAALTSGFGLYLQIYASRFVPEGKATFFNICRMTYPSLSVLFDVAIAIQCFGCAISYLVLIGDIMPTVFIIGNYSEEYQRFFWIMMSTVFCVPLSFLRNLDSLKYTSVMGLFAIGYMLVLIVGFYFHSSTNNRAITVKFPPSALGVASTFSIIVFAFTGHQNMFSIINEAKDKSPRKLNRLIFFAISFTTLLFIVVGLSGYLTFGDNVEGNIILQYPNTWATWFGRLSIVFMVTFSFPLMFHPARISVNNIRKVIQASCLCCNIDTSTEQASEEQQLIQAQENPTSESDPAYTEINDPEMSLKAYYSITSMLLVVGYIISISATSFAKVLAVIGATGSTSISFILPGLFGYKLATFDSPKNEISHTLFRYLSLCLTIWGILVMVLCLYTTLSSGV